MLKAIVTVLDENDRILQANRLIFEDRCTPDIFGTKHEFYFNVMTLDDELVDRFNESLTGFHKLSADGIKEAWKNCTGINEGGKEKI